MKNLLFFTLFISVSVSGISQSAVNFSCNDCTGTAYDLFSHLDAGKVVVIDWVMPCGACIGPSLTTYNVVQGFESQYPGKVEMLLCDDFANTNCTSLTSWANSQGLINTIRFSNSSIRMSDYGSNGMPKVVVLAPDHSVLYNANNSVNAAQLEAAINVGLMMTGEDEFQIAFEPALYPNPAGQETILSINLFRNDLVEIDLFDLNGRKTTGLWFGEVSSGDQQIRLDLDKVYPGVYFTRIKAGNSIRYLKLMVSR